MAYSAFKFSSGQLTPDASNSYCEYKPEFHLHDHTQCVSAFQIADFVRLDYGCPQPGDIVRYDPNKGEGGSDVLAYADLVESYLDPESQVEALGVVEEVHFDCGEDSILGSEKIGKVVFYGRIQFRDSVLEPGRVYYTLSENQWRASADKNMGTNPISWNESTSRGFRNGTTDEPTISKPIYVATGTNIAIITNYRALVGGVTDEVIQEQIDIAVDCSDWGWDVKVTNTGNIRWRGPLEFEAVIDPMDGVSSATVYKTWVGDQLELASDQSWVQYIGDSNTKYLGSLTFNIKRGDTVIKATTKSCIPSLSIQGGCTGEGVVYEVSLNNNIKMSQPLNYTIVSDDPRVGAVEGSLVLPNAGDDTAIQIRPYEQTVSGETPSFGPLQFEFIVNDNHWAKLSSPARQECDKPNCCTGEGWCTLGPNPTTGGANTTILDEPGAVFYYGNAYKCPSDPSKMAISYEYLRENTQFCWPQVESAGPPVELYIYAERDVPSRESATSTNGDRGEIENLYAYVTADPGLSGSTCYLIVDAGGADQICYEFTYSLAKRYYNVKDMIVASGGGTVPAPEPAPDTCVTDDWDGDWSDCVNDDDAEVTCGGGNQYKYRRITSGEDPVDCPGVELSMSQECNTDPCISNDPADYTWNIKSNGTGNGVSEAQNGISVLNFEIDGGFYFETGLDESVERLAEPIAYMVTLEGSDPFISGAVVDIRKTPTNLTILYISSADGKKYGGTATDIVEDATYTLTELSSD